MRAMTSEYIEIDDAVKRASKELLPLKKRKVSLEGNIIESMVSAGVDACNISGTQDKLVVKKAKKKTAVKKSDYLMRLATYFEGDQSKAIECWDFINADTEVVEVNKLRRQTKKEARRQEEVDEPEEGEIRDGEDDDPNEAEE
eukprot:jgi/Mesvir1/18591/Mv17100-RA.1